ncbi:MAG: membrane or secreted protein [Bacteroidota bacterium]
MAPELKIIIITIILLALAITGIAIKMFLKKGGEFKKQCSSIDPATGERFGCTCGSGDSGEACENS